jgi:hypothetical protein
VSVRRWAALGALSVLAGMLVVLVPAPRTPTGEEAVTGPRLFKISAEAVRQVIVTIGAQRVAAVRGARDWAIEGRPVSPATQDAITDLLRTLVVLRAVDRFRPEDAAAFGLDPAHATIEVVSPHRRTRLLLGELNAARSAVYARRDDAPQVMLVGVYLLSALERLVYFASLEARASLPSRDRILGFARTVCAATERA